MPIVNVIKSKFGKIIDKKCYVIPEITIRLKAELAAFLIIQNEYEQLKNSNIVYTINIDYNSETETDVFNNLVKHNKSTIDKINMLKRIMNNGIKHTNRKYNRSENLGLLSMSDYNTIINKIKMNI